jgi:staphylococcal nuclease domain-containing protein 1
MSFPTSGRAIVKAVISGDTVVLRGKSSGGISPPEMVLSLSHVNAPVLAKDNEQVPIFNIALFF